MVNMCLGKSDLNINTDFIGNKFQILKIWLRNASCMKMYSRLSIKGVFKFCMLSENANHFLNHLSQCLRPLSLSRTQALKSAGTNLTEERNHT